MSRIELAIGGSAVVADSSCHRQAPGQRHLVVDGAGVMQVAVLADHASPLPDHNPRLVWIEVDPPASDVRAYGLATSLGRVIED